MPASRTSCATKDVNAARRALIWAKRATSASDAKKSQFTEKSRRAVYSRKNESPSRPYFSQDADGAGPILPFASRNGFARRSDSLRRDANLFFARKYFDFFRKFSQKKRSIPFFSSAATYKVDEGRRRLAFETGSARFGVDRKKSFRPLARLGKAPRSRFRRFSTSTDAAGRPNRPRLAKQRARKGRV